MGQLVYAAVAECNNAEALTFELPRIVSPRTVNEDSMIGGVEYDVKIVLHKLAALEVTKQHEE